MSARYRATIVLVIEASAPEAARAIAQHVADMAVTSEAPIGSSSVLLLEPLAERFLARFVPQMWLRDHAVEVDALGPTQWTPAAIPALLGADVRDAGGLEVLVLDVDDLLKEDDNAPEWIRSWQGPFSIWVRQVLP